MAENIKLEIVTPEKAVVSEDVQIVMSPGTEGEFGVLAGHTPFLTSLKIGTINYKNSEGKEAFVFVSGGFTEALPDKVTVLAESAERRRDIDMSRAKAARQRAEERLAVEHKDVNVIRAEAALSRALYRIKLAETKL
ncbi:MAG: F0F1 ATP synthase subunit epsilon [Deltaproteobacteria bacterium]|nr:F0F1 ATP synthase subunit epsilon [Deltaproteobacteria bacterium]